MTTVLAPPHQESNLIQEAFAGNREAFGQLTGLHLPRALALATGIVGNRLDAEEMVQEATLKAWKARDSFVQSRSFFPWFYRILRNHCIQFLRREKLRKTQSLEVQVDDATSIPVLADRSAPLPEELVQSSECGELIGTALSRLTPQDREVLVLKHFDGLTYRQIAEALTIPLGTVMSRLSSARKRLRALLPEEAI
ncbi:MAG: RNA polymerase sigma factor [Planctomycetes bacterium]|nr:RNA polymerase sigma factor [Planctomycetota bacterium]